MARASCGSNTRATGSSRARPRSPACPRPTSRTDGEATSVEIRLLDEPSGADVTLSYTIFGDLPIVARSVRVRNGGHDRLRITTAMSASLDLPDTDWDAGPAERHVGARASRRRAAARPGPPVDRQPARRLGPRARSLRSSCAGPPRPRSAGEAYGFSLVYSGNFLAEAEVEPVRDDPGPDRDRSRRLRAGPSSPGASSARRRRSSPGRTTGLGGLSDAYHRLYRERLARGTWRDRPRPVLVNNWEGDLLRLRRGQAGRDRDRRPRPRDRAVRPRRRLVRRARRRHELARRLVRRPAQAARRPRRPRPPDRGPRSPLRPVDRARDGQRAEPALRRAPRLGDRRSPGRPRTESRQQLRPRHVPARGRRPPLRRRCPRSSRSAPISYVKWDMNRNITEPCSRGLPADRQGEFFHRYILGVYDLYAAADRRLPRHPVRVMRQRRRPVRPGHARLRAAGLDERRHGRDRAARGSSGAPRSSTPRARWAPMSRPCPTTRPAGSRRSRPGLPSRSSGPSATSSIRRHCRPPNGPTWLARSPSTRSTASVLQRGRFVRLRSPFEDDRNETAWMTVSDDRRRAVVGFYRVLNRPIPARTGSACAASTRRARYRVTTWPAGPTRSIGTTRSSAVATS